MSESIFGIVGVLILADLFFGVIVSPWYFARGPIVVRFRRSIGRKGIGPPSARELNSELLFVRLRDFGECAYGFRRNLAVGSGLLKSSIVFDPTEGNFEVQGRLGWGLLAAIPLILLAPTASLLREAGSIVLILPGMVFVALGLFDAILCFRVARVALRLWAKSAA